MLEHDDHAMRWYDQCDSYSPWYDHGMAVMEDYEVVRTLIIQPM